MRVLSANFKDDRMCFLFIVSLLNLVGGQIVADGQFCWYLRRICLRWMLMLTSDGQRWREIPDNLFQALGSSCT